MDESRYYRNLLRAADDDANVIEGMATPYGVWTPVGGYLERIAPSCFKRSIDRAGSSIPLLAFHDHGSTPIGRPLAWEHRDDGLWCRWQLDTSERAQEMRRLAADGMLTGLSVGFAPTRGGDDWDHSGEVARVTRTEARLLEVSVVPVPAAEEAQIVLVRSAGRRVARPQAEAARRWLEKVSPAASHRGGDLLACQQDN